MAVYYKWNRNPHSTTSYIYQKRSGGDYVTQIDWRRSYSITADVSLIAPNYYDTTVTTRLLFKGGSNDSDDDFGNIGWNNHINFNSSSTNNSLTGTPRWLNLYLSFFNQDERDDFYDLYQNARTRKMKVSGRGFYWTQRDVGNEADYPKDQVDDGHADLEVTIPVHSITKSDNQYLNVYTTNIGINDARDLLAILLCQTIRFRRTNTADPDLLIELTGLVDTPPNYTLPQILTWEHRGPRASWEVKKEEMEIPIKPIQPAPPSWDQKYPSLYRGFAPFAPYKTPGHLSQMPESARLPYKTSLTDKYELGAELDEHVAWNLIKRLPGDFYNWMDYTVFPIADDAETGIQTAITPAFKGTAWLIEKIGDIDYLEDEWPDIVTGLDATAGFLRNETLHETFAWIVGSFIVVSRLGLLRKILKPKRVVALGGAAFAAAKGIPKLNEYLKKDGLLGLGEGMVEVAEGIDEPAEFSSRHSRAMAEAVDKQLLEDIKAAQAMIGQHIEEAGDPTTAWLGRRRPWGIRNAGRTT